MNDYGSFRRHILALPLELFMLAGAVVMYMVHDMLHIATSLFTFLVSFLPLLLERWWKIRLPSWLQFTYVLFVFSSMFCGEVLHFYGHFFWWDDVMHIISGLLISLGVVLWLQLAGQRGIRLPKWARLLLIFTITLTVAALWEFAEFGSDQLLGTHSQDSLTDTMMDMLDAALGASIIMCIYARLLIRKGSLGLAVLTRHFLHFNKG